VKIEVSQPQADGRYVIFVQCASHQVRDWCEPKIATWANGRWHTTDAIFGWIGPIPLAKCAELLDMHNQEYDL